MMDPKSFQLKMQSKELEREARKMMKEAAVNKKKAKAELKKGNRAAAQMYAKNSARYEQQANTILQNAAASTGYANDLRAGRVAADMARTMGTVNVGLGKATRGLNVEHLEKTKNNMSDLKSNMSLAQEIILGGDEVAEAGADDLLAQLEVENEQEAGAQLFDIPSFAPYADSKEKGRVN